MQQPSLLLLQLESYHAMQLLLLVTPQETLSASRHCQRE
jgi:hypothetical protein